MNYIFGFLSVEVFTDFSMDHDAIVKNYYQNIFFSDNFSKDKIVLLYLMPTIFRILENSNTHREKLKLIRNILQAFAFVKH